MRVKQFRASLVKARKNAGLNQHAAGALLDVSQGTVSNWESGRSAPAQPMQVAAIAIIRRSTKS